MKRLVPPFTLETATAKVRAAEDAWNSRDPERVAMEYSEDSQWRNRSTLLNGRAEIREFLQDKWNTELEYRLNKAIRAFGDNQIAVRFQYEYHDADGQWFRAYGNELWQFDEAGLMSRREASINDYAIEESDRKFHWPLDAPRPSDHEGIPTVK